MDWGYSSNFPFVGCLADSLYVLNQFSKDFSKITGSLWKKTGGKLFGPRDLVVSSEDTMR